MATPYYLQVAARETNRHYYALVPKEDRICQI